jgi:hypothetical protein
MTTFEEVEKFFRNTPAMTSLMGQAVLEYLQELQAVDGVYPAQPNRMRSGKLNTYVRGVGTYPASAFTSANVPGGFAVKSTKKMKASGVVKFTSQQMDKRWRTHIETSDNQVLGTLVNDATYSGYVVGEKADQMPYHAETGWQNTDDAVDITEAQLDSLIDKAVDAYIDMI